MKRREFLTTSSLGLLLIKFRPLINSISALAEDQTLLLAAVIEHIFPDETTAPGAKTLNSLVYVLRIMEDSQIPTWERERLKTGILKFKNFLTKEQKVDFADLSYQQKESLLRKFADEIDEGESWLSLLLSYIIESCFGDPVYGVNSNESGWKWIGHTAGFPRPSKPYPLLK